MTNQGIKKPAKRKPTYELEWGSNVPPVVLTHLLTLGDLLSGYVDQESVSVGRLAYKVVHNIDVQNAVICLLFDLPQDEAAKMRRQLIGKKKLDELYVNA